MQRRLIANKQMEAEIQSFNYLILILSVLVIIEEKSELKNKKRSLQGVYFFYFSHTYPQPFLCKIPETLTRDLKHNEVNGHKNAKLLLISEYLSCQKQEKQKNHRNLTAVGDVRLVTEKKSTTQTPVPL